METQTFIFKLTFQNIHVLFGKDVPPTHLLSKEEVVYMSALEVPEHDKASTITDKDFVRMLGMLL